MEQKEKELLFTDVSSRLKYCIKAQYFDIDAKQFTFGVVDSINKDYIVEIDELGFYIDDIKPYLFPLSSMTERQCYELASIRSGFQDCWKYIKTPIPLSICNFEQIDWFHKNHFDYRGLIEKGLAIDATGLNIY